MFRSDRYYWYIGLSVFLLIFDYFSFLNPLKNPILDSIIPMRRIVYLMRLDIRDFSHYLSQYRVWSKVLLENKQFTQENEEARLQVRILSAENEKLRYQLGVILPSSYHFLPSHVISVYDKMEIDTGEKDGVKPGMTVISGTTYIGKVVLVKNSRSTILLPTDPQSIINAKTEMGAKGELTGQQGSGMVFDKVLQKDQLLLGDQLITSGEDGLVPNLLLGKIVSITNNDASVYKQAKIVPQIDFISQNTVFVITQL